MAITKKKKKQEIANAYKNVEKLEFSYVVGRNSAIVEKKIDSYSKIST